MARFRNRANARFESSRERVPRRRTALRGWESGGRRGRMRGARIGLGSVTEPRARAYGFDLAAWKHMMLEASAVDPREIVRRGQKLGAILSKPGRLEITAPNGTRFSCALVGREAGVEDGMTTKEGL